MFEFFIALTLWPWITLGIGLVLLFWCAAADKYGPGIIVFIIAALIFDWFTHWNLFKFISQNPMKTLIGFLIYCGIGVIWSIIKFYFHMNYLKRKYQEDKVMWLKRTDKTESDWLDSYEGKVPDFKECTRDAIWWMIYWPFSFVMTFLGDVLRKFFEHLYDLFSGIYQKIYNAFIKNFN